MKCINCGFPLSPTNKNSYCPRCHTDLASGPKAAVASPSQQYDNYRPGEMQGAQWGQGQSPPFSSPPTWQTNAQPNQFSLPPVAQTPFPQPGQIWQPDPTPSLPTAPFSMMETARHNSDPGRIDNLRTGTLSGLLSGGEGHQLTRSSAPGPAARFQRPRTSNVGFIVAGLFVMTGALLLVFVHFMALGLPSANTASAYTSTPTATRNTLPSPTAALSPTPASSPTAQAFPAQQYIDNPQMATLVNTNTAQPIQTATTFKVNQRIYVTFNIHPNGKNGAVCLFWYLGSKIVTQYPFPVTASANAGYSYSIYGGAGQAHVEIYWASSTACTDKILAQHVSFTVTR